MAALCRRPGPVLGLGVPLPLRCWNDSSSSWSRQHVQHPESSCNYVLEYFADRRRYWCALSLCLPCIGGVNVGTSAIQVRQFAPEIPLLFADPVNGGVHWNDMKRVAAGLHMCQGC